MMKACLLYMHVDIFRSCYFSIYLSFTFSVHTEVSGQWLLTSEEFSHRDHSWGTAASPARAIRTCVRLPDTFGFILSEMPSDDIFSMTRRWDFYKNILIIRLISIDLTCRSEFVYRYLYCSEWVKNTFVQPTKIMKRLEFRI
jgi:hypothetical protein